MSLTYGFFDAVYDSDSGTYDRTYTAEQFSTYLKGIISDGVVANVGNQLAVTPNSGMAIQVGTGRMFINSRWMDNDTVIDLTVGAANGALPRKDIVVVRLDYSGRAIGITVKAGTAAATPTAPSVQRDSTYYEMELAEINVKAGATAITAADITDKRADQTVCGYVVGLVDQIDTAGMWSQLEAGFGTWFEEMKDQLSEDAAGNLQLQINDLEDASEAAADTLTDLTGSQATSVSSGTDLNTLTDTGIYQIGDLSQMVNGPLRSGYGSLEVNRSRTYVLQRFVNMSPTIGPTEYVRVSVNNGATWRAWGYSMTPVLITPTIGNGNIMAYIVNTTHQVGNELYINCGIRFTGARAANTLLIRLPSAVNRSQYIQMIKISGGVQSAYVSSVSGGGTDIGCPTAFENGDRVYITGVITLI